MPGFGSVDCEAWGVLIVALEKGCGDHLGEVVCVAGVAAGEIGARVLLDDRLPVDGYDGPGVEAVELCVASDEPVFPRVHVVV